MANVKKAAGKKVKAVKLVTPIGRLSYPYLANPDEGRENSDGKYKTDLLIPKDVWKKEGKELRDAVLTCGRKFYKDKSLELSDFVNPFKDTDKMDKYSEEKDVKGCILIRCKSEFPPLVVGPSKKELSEDERNKIKGGDYARLVVAVYSYPNKEGGVTLGLNLVQYVKPGEALGGGRAAILAQIDEIEIEPDDVDVDDEEEAQVEEDEGDDEEEAPVKKKSKKVIDDDEPEEEETEEVEDEDSEEEVEEEPDEGEEEEAPKKKKSKKVVEEDEEEDDQESFSFDDDDEEEAPKKKKSKR